MNESTEFTRLHGNVETSRGLISKRQKYITLTVVIVPTLSAVIAISQIVHGIVTSFDLLLLLGMYVITLIGVEAGFHRLVSHKAFKTSKWIYALFVIAGSMAAQGPVLYWAATHRRHHKLTDMPGDPHSPWLHGATLTGKIKGLIYAHVGWLFDNQQSDWVRYAADLIKDKFIFRLHQLYPLWVMMGLLIPGAIAGSYYGSWDGAAKGVLWGGLVRILLVHHGVWSVNSICHRFGSQSFATKCNSTNNIWLSLVSLGGSWHNNHHAFPITSSNAFRWWQLDPCGWVIKSLGLMRLAWDLKFPTTEQMKAKAKNI